MDDWTGRYTKVAGYAVYFTVFVAAFELMLARQDRLFNVLVGLTIAGSIALYCALDSRLHGKVFVRAYWFVTLLTWPVAPLALLVRSRGSRGATHYFKHLAFLLLLAAAAGMLGTIFRLPLEDAVVDFEQ